MSHDLELSPDADVVELQTRLAEREHLVKELTSRLEQAAEQLDRFRRTGANRGGHVVGGGMPQELIDEQRALTENLQDAVQQWEDMQPTTLLSRLEMQVSEIRDLIVSGGTGNGQPVAEPKSLVEHLFSAAESEPPKKSEKEEPSSAVETPSENSGLSTYEMFKAGLTGEEPSDPPAESVNVDPPETEPEVPDVAEIEQPVEIEPTDEPPQEIDFATATEADLRTAIDERDSYIADLLRRLRLIEGAPRYSGSWAELEGVPDELRARLEDYESRLEESLRRAEIETSVERARLGREANRLALWDEQLNKKAAELGMLKECDSEGDGEDMTPKKRRWLRMFGKKSSDD